MMDAFFSHQIRALPLQKNQFGGQRLFSKVEFVKSMCQRTQDPNDTDRYFRKKQLECQSNEVFEVQFPRGWS